MSQGLSTQTSPACSSCLENGLPELVSIRYVEQAGLHSIQQTHHMGLKLLVPSHLKPLLPNKYCNHMADIVVDIAIGINCAGID